MTIDSLKLDLSTLIGQEFGTREHDQIKGQVNEESVSSKPISLELEIDSQKLSDSILAHFRLNAKVRLSCSRCTKDIDHLIFTEFDREFSLNPEEDQILIENNQVDLEPIILEEIILNIPMQPLCNELCKGINIEKNN